MDLFKTLFETFASISDKDVQNGMIAGQKSVYSNTSSGSLERAINDIKKNEKSFSNQLKRKRDVEFQSAITTVKKSNKDVFDNYAGRLTAQLEQNGIYSWDPTILKAVVELITYAYLSLTKEEPKVYNDILRAKQVTQIIFSKLENGKNGLGIKFPTTDIKEQFQISVLSTFYNINAKSKKEEKPEENKKENGK